MIRRSTLVVLGVFILMLVLAWALQNRQAAAPEATPTATEEAFIPFAVSDLASLRIIGPDGSVLYISRKAGGSWTLIQPALEGVLDSARVDANLSQLVSVSPLTRLEAAVGLESMGLVTPQYVIRLQSQRGEETLLEVGNETPTQSGYYVQVDNAAVLVAQKFAVQAVIDMLKQIPLQPTPTPEASITPEGTETPLAELTPTP